MAFASMAWAVSYMDVKGRLSSPQAEGSIKVSDGRLPNAVLSQLLEEELDFVQIDGQEVIFNHAYFIIIDWSLIEGTINMLNG